MTSSVFDSLAGHIGLSDGLSVSIELQLNFNDALVLLDASDNAISLGISADDNVQLADEVSIGIGLIGDRKVPYLQLMHGLRGI